MALMNLCGSELEAALYNSHASSSLNSESDSDSDSDSDSNVGYSDWATRTLQACDERQTRLPATAVGLPQSRSQSSFLANLWKLLLDSADLDGVEDWIHWQVMETQPGVKRVGYMIHWDVVLSRWDQDVLPTLVRYRLFRRSNRSECALHSWSRKAREWSMTIAQAHNEDGTASNCFFYYTDPARCTYEFRPGVHWCTFPVARCRRQHQQQCLTQSLGAC